MTTPCPFASYFWLVCFDFGSLVRLGLLDVGLSLATSSIENEVLQLDSFRLFATNFDVVQLGLCCQILTFDLQVGPFSAVWAKKCGFFRWNLLKWHWLQQSLDTQASMTARCALLNVFLHLLLSFLSVKRKMC